MMDDAEAPLVAPVFQGMVDARVAGDPWDAIHATIAQNGGHEAINQRFAADLPGGTNEKIRQYYDLHQENTNPPGSDQFFQNLPTPGNVIPLVPPEEKLSGDVVPLRPGSVAPFGVPGMMGDVLNRMHNLGLEPGYSTPNPRVDFMEGQPPLPDNDNFQARMSDRIQQSIG